MKCIYIFATLLMVSMVISDPVRRSTANKPKYVEFSGENSEAWAPTVRGITKLDFWIGCTIGDEFTLLDPDDTVQAKSNCIRHGSTQTAVKFNLSISKSTPFGIYSAQCNNMTYAAWTYLLGLCDFDESAKHRCDGPCYIKQDGQLTVEQPCELPKKADCDNLMGEKFKMFICADNGVGYKSGCHLDAAGQSGKEASVRIDSEECKGKTYKDSPHFNHNDTNYWIYSTIVVVRGKEIFVKCDGFSMDSKVNCSFIQNGIQVGQAQTDRCVAANDFPLPNITFGSSTAIELVCIVSDTTCKASISVTLAFLSPFDNGKPECNDKEVSSGKDNKSECTFKEDISRFYRQVNDVSIPKSLSDRVIDGSSSPSVTNGANSPSSVVLVIGKVLSEIWIKIKYWGLYCAAALIFGAVFAFFLYLIPRPAAKKAEPVAHGLEEPAQPPGEIPPGQTFELEGQIFGEVKKQPLGVPDQSGISIEKDSDPPKTYPRVLNFAPVDENKKDQ